jgi:hypothetical protein
MYEPEISTELRRILHVYRMEIQDTRKKVCPQMASAGVLKTEAAFIISKRGEL